MAANVQPIFPVTPVASFADLTSITACTTRAPTATAGLAAANIIQLLDVSTNGQRVDTIRVKGASSSFTAATAAQTVTIWQWDGTKAWPIREILVTLTTPSTTVASFEGSATFTDLILPPTHKLYVSTSITTTAATTALIVEAVGGAY